MSGTSPSFERDAYPGRPRILFVGPGESSHTHSWVDLLEGEPFNVRVFAMPQGSPPDSWPVRTYITEYAGDIRDSATRRRLYPRARVARFARRNYERFFGAKGVEELSAKWLADIVRRWRPHVVHTFGLAQGEFYFDARRRYGLEGAGGVWVLQTRGGSDLALSRLDPAQRGRIGEVMRACDQLLSDNPQNFQIARELGVRDEQLSSIGTVPGTGGIDVEALAGRWRGSPSARRLIVWPKVYECHWSKALPVFEALKLCWERIRPCEIELLAMSPETRMWFWALPEEIRASCRTRERIPRAEALELMTRARVMLAPTLVDGVPNSMYEAMAAGAFPVVSPLETILPVVEQEQNVLFARNLYPEEVAAALARAMTDDALVDAAAERNLALVRRVADRGRVRPRVLDLYERLAG
ncbi:MAG TPA: glycosyltransferase family 4 protein, partial [Pyrinomonadaceae bacterium]|nr:glycosyltransferase family 4 protein [Pyrinomonadaceae bacterium]